MSEEAAAEAVTEAPVPTTVVEEGGPTSFAEASRLLGDLNISGDPQPPSMEEMTDALLSPEPEVKEEQEEAAPVTEEAPAETPETPETPADDTIDPDGFGFEKAGEEKADVEAFDTEAFDKETEAQVQDLDPKAGDGWRKLRSRLKEAEIKAQEASKSAVNVEELEKTSSRLRELEERNKELESEHYSIKVQNSPEWREKVSGPRDDLISLAKQVAQEYSEEEVTSEEVLSIFTEKSIRKRGEMTQALKDKGVDDLVIHEIGRGYSTYQNIEREHERMLKNAEGEWEEIQAQREASNLKASEEHREAIKRHLDDKWEKASKVFGEDAIRDARRRSSSIDIREATPANQAHGQFAGELLPVALAEVKRLRAELGEKVEAAAKARKASPNLSEGAVEERTTEKKAPATLAEASRMAGDLSL